MILSCVAGLILVLAILLEAFETVVLPRRVSRRLRITVLFYRMTWRPWRALARLMRRKKLRESFLGYYGPLSLLVLFIFWATLLVIGFGLVYSSASYSDPTHPRFQTCLYLSGTTFFTLGIGDVTPHTQFERVMIVIESGLGFGFLALVLSYLPVIYQAFSRREVNIVMLDARAGSPPTAAELLRRHSGPRELDALEVLFREWEHWSAEILESHISYPVVSYFRSQHNNESWLGALTAILDATALILTDGNSPCRARRNSPSPCAATPSWILAQVFYATPRNTGPNRLPPEDLQRMRKQLTDSGLGFLDSPESNAKLDKLRQMYEPYLNALAAHLYVELPPWILAKEAVDNWRTSAWGRISGFSPSEKTSSADDH